MGITWHVTADKCYYISSNIKLQKWSKIMSYNFILVKGLDILPRPFAVPDLPIGLTGLGPLAKVYISFDTVIGL